MNKKTIFLSITMFQITVLLFSAPVYSEDELPVEIDIELIYETMSLKQALNRFKEDADSGRISVAQIDTAGNAMIELTRQGISVNRAFESVQEALRQNRDPMLLTSESRIMNIKKQLIKEELRHQIMKKGRNGRQAETAFRNFERLLNNGASMEAALKSVFNNIGIDPGALDLDHNIWTDTGINSNVNVNYDNSPLDDDTIIPMDKIQEENNQQEIDKGNKKK